MTDAWVYGQGEALAAEVVRALAELGFSPRRPEPDGPLVPPPDGAGAARPPGLAVLVGAAGTPAPVEIWKRLREHEELAELPVVVTLETEHLTGAEEFADADELIIGPFSPEELKVRVARARREVNRVQAGEIVRAGSLELNLATYQASVAGRPVSFAYKEYELLRFLMTHPNRVFSRQALLSRVWGYDYYGGARTVDVHVRRVRAKLGQEHAARLKTIRSVGYRFET